MVYMFMLDLVGAVAHGQWPAVVLRGHDFAVGSCGSDGQQVAATGGVQINLLGEYVCGFTYRSYDIVGFKGAFTTDVFYFMICLVEGRTYEVCESCIDNGKFLYGSFLNI